MKKTFKTKTAYISVDWKTPEDAKKYTSHQKHLMKRLRKQVIRAEQELRFWKEELKFWSK